MPAPDHPPGTQTAPARTDRLFFAVQPDARARQAISALLDQLRGEYRLQARPVAAERLHSTLCVLGDFPGLPQDIVAAASQAAQAAAASIPAFTVSFDQVQTFMTRARKSGRRPLVLGGADGAAGMHALYQALSCALLKAGLPATPPGFTPHVTMMYDAAIVPAHPVCAVSWPVAELVLLHSRIGCGLPYAVLGRWPLGR